MKILNYRILEHVAVNLKDVMKDKKRKVELEERLRLGLANANNVDPSTFTVDIVYNKMADSFDLKVKQIEN